MLLLRLWLFRKKPFGKGQNSYTYARQKPGCSNFTVDRSSVFSELILSHLFFSQCQLAHRSQWMILIPLCTLTVKFGTCFISAYTTVLQENNSYKHKIEFAVQNKGNWTLLQRIPGKSNFRLYFFPPDSFLKGPEFS